MIAAFAIHGKEIGSDAILKATVNTWRDDRLAVQKAGKLCRKSARRGRGIPVRITIDTTCGETG